MSVIIIIIIIIITIITITTTIIIIIIIITLHLPNRLATNLSTAFDWARTFPLSNSKIGSWPNGVFPPENSIRIHKKLDKLQPEYEFHVPFMQILLWIYLWMQETERFQNYISHSMHWKKNVQFRSGAHFNSFLFFFFFCYLKRNWSIKRKNWGSPHLRE